MMNKLNIRFWAIACLILCAAISRIIPHHIPNFTPITAIALFSGVYLRKYWSFSVPLLALIISDFCLEMMNPGYGFNSGRPVIYASFALMVFIGYSLRGKTNVANIAVKTLAGSTVFFLITNFAVWISSGMYPHTFEGFMSCYTMALPFFRNSLLGDFIYSALLFGGFAMAQAKFPIIEESTTIA